jgi:hypothetical protein
LIILHGGVAAAAADHLEEYVEGAAEGNLGSS